MLAGQLHEPAELARAHRVGLTPPAVRQLRSLLDERSRNAWAIGDVLVAAYGPGSTSGVGDGSRRCRANTTPHSPTCLAGHAANRRRRQLVRALARHGRGWRPRNRRSCSWSLHAMLRAHPERIRMLEVFLTACERDHLTRIVGRLEMALGEKSRTLAVEDRIERLALRLDHDRLARVVDRLRRLLDADEVPMAA